MRISLSVLALLLAAQCAIAQSLPAAPQLIQPAQPAQPPKPLYLLCKGGMWSHESGFGASASTPGTTTIRIDQEARKATFQTPILGELQGELTVSDESYSSHVELAKARAHMGRAINAVVMSVNRFTGRASISYLLADGGQHPAFTGECQPASPKF